MNRAVSGLSVVPSLVLVDGNYASGFSVCAETVIHGYAISPNIAAHRLLQRLPVTVYAKSLIKNILGTELPSTRVILLRRIRSTCKT